MLSKVPEDVDESVSHLAWRGERTAVPAIGPKPPFSPNELVDRARNTNRDAAHAARQSSLVARFGYEVNVIPLDGEMKHTKTGRIALRGASDGETNHWENVLTT